MAEPDSFYAAAERRIEWLTLALGIAGAGFAYMRWGWRSGTGVALGAALMWLNFRWLKQGVNALVKVSTAQAASEQPGIPRGVYVKFFGRFALLLVVVYVILSRSLVPVPAILGGLFAVVAAVMLELVWELATFRRPPGTVRTRGKRGTETHS
jgi:ATP synthase I chain